MLRSDFRFPLSSRTHRLIAFLLGEAFLGFLAIVAVGLTLFPMLFTEEPPKVYAAIETFQWMIIAWFAVEYIVGWVSAPAKRAFFLSPWRLIDLATILIPLASLLPSVSRALMSSPVLRLVRLARLVTLGVRVSGLAARQRPARMAEIAGAEPMQITRMDGAGAATWDAVLGWSKTPGPAWFHVSNPGPAQLAELGKSAGLPAGFLENHLLNTSYPHTALARSFGAIFVWLPVANAVGRIERHAVLFVFSNDHVLSLVRRAAPAHGGMVAPGADAEAPHTPFAARVIGGVLQTVMRQNEKLVGGSEEELRALEEVPIRESSPAFFERTFRLKKELSVTQADLWRLKGVVAELAGGRLLPRLDESGAETFRRLASEAEYLYETVVNVRDEVLSVLELHLNIVSFDMNRVMRVLAVVSVLGLIPAVIGGLFGMNLIDNPWPFTLPQVAFTVSFAMVLCVYFFFVKGWLR